GARAARDSSAGDVDGAGGADPGAGGGVRREAGRRRHRGGRGRHGRPRRRRPGDRPHRRWPAAARPALGPRRRGRRTRHRRPRGPRVTMRPAVFLDRDGTLNVDAGFVRQPADVVLIPGAARAIARLNAAQVPVVIVTNQSGIGRGLMSTADYAAVRDRLTELLREQGAYVDATYECPHDPRVG